MAKINGILKQILLGILQLYRMLISPWMGSHCRFYPSCSHYAIGALDKFGIIKGCWLTLLRLLKCHPWHEGGIDEVP